MQFEENLDIQRIMADLPHRYPMLLIDRILELKRPSNQSDEWDGSYVKALKNVTVNEEFFNGHFPGNPIMPGVLIVEAMAQACATVAAFPRDDGQRWNFLIASVNNTKFRKPVIPGDSLVLHSVLRRVRSGTRFIFDCEATVDGEKRAESEILAVMY